MTEQRQKGVGVLYVVVCAAPPATDIQELIVLAQSASWEVCVIATPQAIKFIDIPLLTRLTNYPIRSEYKSPREPDVLPKPDAIIVAPATFNTINKWAIGIADTLAASILSEYLSSNIPIIAVPCLKPTLAQHPAFSPNVTLLREYGVHILHDPEKYPSPMMVPWEVILSELDKQAQIS